MFLRRGAHFTARRHVGQTLTKCGAIRYSVSAAPTRATICHCTFCQKITGSAYLVEPVFRREDFAFSGAMPKAFVHRSDSCHKKVAVHFCETCATKIYLVFGETFDDPNWFDRSALTAGVGNKALALKNCHNIILRDFSALAGRYLRDRRRQPDQQ